MKKIDKLELYKQFMPVVESVPINPSAILKACLHIMVTASWIPPDNTLSDPNKCCKELQPGLLILSHYFQC